MMEHGLDYPELAEKAVIGLSLTSPDALLKIQEVITPADLYIPLHRNILTAAIQVQDAGLEVDVISVAEQLEKNGETADLGQLIEFTESATSTANSKSVAHVVRDKSRIRQSLAVIDSVLELRARDKTITSEKLLDSLIGGLNRIENSSSEINSVSLNEALKIAVERVDRAFQLNGTIDGLSTGWSDIDSRLGGLKGGELYVVAGRPGMGKSVFAMNIAANISMTGKHGLVFSLEMSEAMLAQRFIACYGGVGLKTLRDGTLKEHDWPALTSGVAKLKGAPMTIVDQGQLHINQIKAYARKTHQNNRLNYLVVDHIHIARGDGESQNLRIGSISGGLKALAKELDIPVIAVAQLNRGSEDKDDQRPELKHLKGSSSIEEDADAVIMLYREDYYKPDSNRKGTLEVYTRKHRSGEPGVDYLGHDLSKSRLFDYVGVFPQEEERTNAKPYRYPK